MLIKCKGIVLRLTRYGDTSVIVTAFTDTDGIQSFLVKGARSAQKQSKMAFFQPLTLLELVVYKKDNASLQHLREIKCYFPYRNIPGDIRRESVAFFVTEVLNRVLREQTDPEVLYEFLETSLMHLDSASVSVEMFHLQFLMDLSRHLGFGAGQPTDVLGDRVVPAEIQEALADLIQGSGKFNHTAELRRDLLHLLIDYLRRHVDQFGQLRSVDVLREVLH